MPVPSLMRLVALATAASAMNGSRVREYSGGRLPPCGHGVSRLTGMCVCSGKKSDSKPRSSAWRPSSTGSIEESVGNIFTPNFIQRLMKQFSRGQLSAFYESTQFGPHDRRRNAGQALALRKAAVGASNDVLASN